MQSRIFLVFIVFILYEIVSIQTQSTCPVIQPINTALQQSQQQRCKCGIKIDGHIYIYCARKQLKQLPKFTRSSILYDELILSGNSIQTVRANSFLGLKVKRLYLDDNPIRAIEPAAFTELANYLEELYISVSVNSQLIPTVAGSSDSITVIKSLRRTPIPTRLFQSLLNLKIIKLNGLDLNEDLRRPLVNSEYFMENIDEEVIDTRGGVLLPNLFNRTRKLEVIHLVDCNIRRVEPYSLNGVESSLRELNLDNNGLTTTQDIFNEILRMRRLKSLNLSRNKISQLSRFSFLNEDDLAASALSELSLDLSFNAMQKIDENSFGQLSRVISKLNLNNNELNQFQLSFLRHESSNANLKFDNLKELHLDYNKIEFIPDSVLQSLSKLEVLSMRGNLIQHLSSEMPFYGLSLSLKKLNLAGNRIGSISKRVFVHAGKLRELNLERNQLTQNVSFEGLDELKSLNLEGNELNAENLLMVKTLTGLETLRIGHNPLKRLDNQDIFKSIRNLSYLDIQNAQLTRMPYLTGLNSSLVTLNVAQNLICNVNGQNIRRAYPKLKNLNLNSNPLKCDCHLISLRQWLDEIATLNANAQSMTTATALTTSTTNEEPTEKQYTPMSLNWKCAGPNFNSNKYLNRLQPSDLMCFDEEETAGEATCELDDDFTKSTLPAPSSVATTTSKLTSTAQSTIKTEADIQIVQPHPNLILPVSESTSATTKAANLLLMKEELLATDSNQKRDKDQLSSGLAFFSSSELKQTLIGSLIGALSVLLIVFLLVCLIKTGRNNKFRKANNSSMSDTKEAVTNMDGSATTKSKYELGKLSLQTLCINSSGSSSSSSASSSSNNSNTTGNTNSCLCSIIHPLDTTTCTNLTTATMSKIDPLRMTLINSGHQAGTLYHPGYFLSAQQQQQQQQANNLHYLASNLPLPPYTMAMSSPNETATGSTLSSAASPVPPPPASNLNYTAGYTSMMSDANTYDKLHQQRQIGYANSTNTLIRVPLNLSSQLMSSHFGTLHHAKMINNNVTGTLSPGNGESTPFLIITDMNRFLLENQQQQQMHQQQLNDTFMMQQQQQQMKKHQPELDSPSHQQHTYHEIGDALLNYNNNNSTKVNNQSETGAEKKPSEMYI